MQILICGKQVTNRSFQRKNYEIKDLWFVIAILLYLFGKYTNVDLKASLVIVFRHYSEKPTFLGAVSMEVGSPG